MILQAKIRLTLSGIEPQSQQEKIPMEVLATKYEGHKDRLYFVEERLLIQLLESLRSENKDLSDKVDCLQRSLVYVHNHISQVETAVNQTRKIILGLNIGPLEIYPGELN